MFSGCSSLSDLKPLEKWDVSKCTDFSCMFSGCSKLLDIKQLEKWGVTKNQFERVDEKIKEFRDEFCLSENDYTDEQIYEILEKYNFDVLKAMDNFF